MRDRTRYPVKAPQRELTDIVLRFTGAGAGAPTGVVGDGVTSVTRTGTGAYRIQLAGRGGYYEIFPLFQIQSTTAIATANQFIRVTAVDKTNRRVDIAVGDLDTPAAGDLTANETVYALIKVQTAPTT